MNVDVLVIGGGVAGTNAALALQEKGLSVGLSSAGAAGSWFWSGVASVFGPTAPLPRAMSPHELEAPSLRAPEAPRSQDERWAMLRERAPDHPYFCAAASPANVVALAQYAAERLGVPLEWPSDPVAVLTDQGTTRIADAYVNSVLALESGVEGVVLTDALGTEPEWIAHGYRAATGAACSVLSGPELERQGPGDRQVFAPSLRAARFEDVTALRAELKQRLDCDVRECAGSVDSIFGERLRHALADAQTRLARIPAISALPTSGDGWSSGLGCASGPWRARTILIATGGTLGRGSRCHWSEPWRREPQRAVRSPWLSPEVAGGFSVDGELRLLVRGRQLGGVWVAGAGLAGHDPATDGTAFGVALWSSEHAANALSAELYPAGTL
ncbi:MAG: glycine/D-amino acid oxidase-like deaminating enzyme [Bradymonadia bacterium]|jgi:glycine/D-amino acid oxidase-like deaminating enzyme